MNDSALENGDVPADGELNLPPEDEERLMVREANKLDLAFILSGWLRSFRIGDLCKGVGNDRYFAGHKRLVMHLLGRCTVLIACLEAAPTVNVGFVCAEAFDGGTRLLHYVYVKEGDGLRGMGIASMLLKALDDIEPATTTICTHRTRRGRYLMARPGWVYDPYALWGTLKGGWDGVTPEPRPLLDARVRAGARR